MGMNLPYFLSGAEVFVSSYPFTALFSSHHPSDKKYCTALSINYFFSGFGNFHH